MSIYILNGIVQGLYDDEENISDCEYSCERCLVINSSLDISEHKYIKDINEILPTIHDRYIITYKIERSAKKPKHYMLTDIDKPTDEQQTILKHNNMDKPDKIDKLNEFLKNFKLNLFYPDAFNGTGYITLSYGNLMTKISSKAIKQIEDMPNDVKNILDNIAIHISVSPPHETIKSKDTRKYILIPNSKDVKLQAFTQNN